MGLRLNPHRFYLRLWFYLLPALVFPMVFYLRFDNGAYRSWSEAELRFYIVVFAFASIVWAIAAERNRLCQIEDLFREYSGVYKCFSACCVTYVALTCFLFFYRGESVSRMALATSGALLFSSAVVSRIAFRFLLGRRFRPEHRLRVLIVGADQHAAIVAKRLRNMPFASCEIVGHVGLAQQKVVIDDVPTYTMEEVHKGLPVRIDDVIIALPPERLPRTVRCRAAARHDSRSYSYRYGFGRRRRGSRAVVPIRRSPDARRGSYSCRVSLLLRG